MDTNILLRCLIGEDDAQGAAARQVFQSRLTTDNPGFVSTVVLVEALWVLRSRYGASRENLIDIVEQLLTDPRIAVQDEDVVWAALHDHGEHGGDLPDALVAAIAQAHHCDYTLTFDTRAARLPGMRLLETA
ncbi:MAG: PIN domain-containing protein [Aquabacterium sp.]